MNSYLVIIIVIALFAMIISIVTFYNTSHKESRENVVPNEEDSWKWGIIYYNPADSRILVPKKIGLGFTLNFARPISAIIILVITLLLVLAILSKVK